MPAYLTDRMDVWRIVGSPDFSVSLREIESEWTMADVWDANILLDVREDVANLAALKRS